MTPHCISLPGTGRLHQRRLWLFTTENVSIPSNAPIRTPSQPKGIPIPPFNKTVNTQSFFFQWYVDSLKLAPGDRIGYYAQVWDNDGVNGAKSARSRPIQFTVPSKDQLEAEVRKSEQETENQMQSAMKKAQSLQKDLDNLDNKLKSNKELDFKEQKQVEGTAQTRGADERVGGIERKAPECE